MGNHRNGTPTRQRNQTPKIQISTAATGGNSFRNLENDTISIRLEKVDSNAVKQAKIKDVVTLSLEENIFEVSLQQQRIGTIPVAFNSILSAQRIKQARIELIRLSPTLEVIIKVSLNSIR
ncbi:hypothetical protein [Runella sp. SP2]|uniref:hypothetical protein n=1 Tax=Runella sp. SP2 TaxID=2268026 RepID=UPI000F097521|nr:hypothetical protein [Runella sp. SP2]AYQ30982.1 hypothetical protein DTQ70_01765 [Runella sp. SP2]